MGYKAVIFDLDGTLLDTLRDLAEATNVALAELGFPSHLPAAYRYFVGDGRDLLAYRALPATSRDAKTINRLVELINREYELRWRQHSFPYPGIPELLDALTAKQVKMAVLSNKAHNFTEEMVKQMLAKWHFNAIYGAGSQAPKKPDPQSTLQISRELGIPVTEFVFVGDTDIDMKTATAAGMYPVGALWGFRTAAELKNSGARLLISHPLELLSLFP